MDAQGGGGGGGGSARRVGTAAKQQQSSSTTTLPAALVVEALMTRRWWWPLRGCATRRALPAVCVAAAVAAAVIVLTAGSSSWGSPPIEMPGSLFFDYAQGSEPMLKNITAEHLLDGLLTTNFSYPSCRSRYEFSVHHKSSPHKPSPYLIAKLRKQEALQQRCGPGTAAHKAAVRRLDSGEGGVVDADADGCRYLVSISYRGLGNRILAITSAFLYAVLTDRVLLVDGGKDADALFCEPFPGTTWLLPRAGWLSSWFSRSPLTRLQGYEGGSTEPRSGTSLRGSRGCGHGSCPGRPCGPPTGGRGWTRGTRRAGGRSPSSRASTRRRHTTARRGGTWSWTR